MADSFQVKDSGKREQFASGMVRDTVEDKINWSLIADGPMMKRWAIHLTKGAKKYSTRNWMKAAGDGEYERFRESAFRHFMAWYLGETDEDHGAAVMFNINGAEYVKGRLGDADINKSGNSAVREGGISSAGTTSGGVRMAASS